MLEYLILSSGDEAVIQEWRKPRPAEQAPAPGGMILTAESWTVRVATASSSDSDKYVVYIGHCTGEMPLDPRDAHSNALANEIKAISKTPSWMPPRAKR